MKGGVCDETELQAAVDTYHCNRAVFQCAEHGVPALGVQQHRHMPGGTALDCSSGDDWKRQTGGKGPAAGSAGWGGTGSFWDFQQVLFLLILPRKAVRKDGFLFVKEF